MPLPQGVISSTISGDVRWQAKAGIYSQLLTFESKYLFEPKNSFKRKKKKHLPRKLFDFAQLLKAWSRISTAKNTSNVMLCTNSRGCHRWYHRSFKPEAKGVARIGYYTYYANAKKNIIYLSWYRDIVSVGWSICFCSFFLFPWMVRVRSFRNTSFLWRLGSGRPYSLKLSIQSSSKRLMDMDTLQTWPCMSHPPSKHSPVTFLSWLKIHR